MPENNSPFSPEDLQYLLEHGISEEEAQRQFSILTQGAYYPNVVAPASLKEGIMSVTNAEKPYYLQLWDEYRGGEASSIVKFVPASGAASRMFQDLFPISGAEEPLPLERLSDSQKSFFEHINDFAFLKDLNEACLRNDWMSVSRLISAEKLPTVIQNLLTSRGLNYGSMPKGQIPFHSYPTGEIRTAALEHLAEGALVCKDQNGRVKIHFTVAPDKQDPFEDHIDRHREEMEDSFGVFYDLSYSIQSPATDTLALEESGELFRKSDGTLLLRPGGHGALLRNLQQLDADIVIIKNIDNVSPDYLKGGTIFSTKLLGGILLEARRRSFDYLNRIDSGKSISSSMIKDMLDFLKNIFGISLNQSDLVGDKEKIERIYNKLNRPIRVCGMVHNDGEQGGGPFIVREPDGSTSLQILEQSQFENDEASQKISSSSTYFNPVLLVCSMRDFRGNPFDLENYVNPQMAFISSKSYEGRKLKSLEYPGLWNGSMDRWNTIFVEVSRETFTPVKSVLDLLRPQHGVMKE